MVHNWESNFMTNSVIWIPQTYYVKKLLCNPNYETPYESINDQVWDMCFIEIIHGVPL